MKSSLNPDVRRRLLLLAGLILTLWATWQVGQDAPAPTAVTERTVRRAPAKPAAPTPELPLMWPVRAESQPSITDVFTPIPPAAVALPTVAPVGPPKPVFKLKYIGHLLTAGENHAFLADEQDRVTTAKVGQAVGDDWQLTTMTDKQLVFRHTPTGQENTLQIGTLQ
jgi:hypothetical protein